jgi:hypothetical protein
MMHRNSGLWELQAIAKEDKNETTKDQKTILLVMMTSYLSVCSSLRRLLKISCLMPHLHRREADDGQAGNIADGNLEGQKPKRFSEFCVQISLSGYNIGKLQPWTVVSNCKPGLKHSSGQGFVPSKLWDKRG